MGRRFRYPSLVATGTVTQANMKISAVDGTAFVDFTAANILTTKIGHLLVVRDSAGRAIQGYIKAAGTGETLSAEMWDADASAFTSGTYGWNKYGENLMENDANSLKVTYVDDGRGAYIRLRDTADLNADTIIDALYKIVADVKGVSGKTAKWNISPGKFFPVPTDSFASQSVYFVANSTTNMLMSAAYSMTSDSILWIKNQSLMQTLTPSTTGVTISSTKSSAGTENWAQKDASFDYNDASGYTYQIIYY